jgi:hypothetical protein
VHSDVADVISKTSNLEILTYENPTGNHEQLTSSIKDLAQKVEAARVELVRTLNW